MAKQNMANVQDNHKLPLPYRVWIDQHYMEIKFAGWLLFSIYSCIAFYKLVIDRLVNVVLLLARGEYTLSELGLFDYSTWRGTTNFVPFDTIMRYINYAHYFNVDLIVVNLLGNLLIFTPMGFLLPLLSRRFRRVWPVLFVGFVSSLAVEIIQFIFRVGSTDIDDLILNTAGAWLGYIAYKFIIQFSEIKQTTT